MSMTHTKEFRLTGRHVLAMTVGFFGLIFAANIVLVWLALGSFPGTVTDSSYRSSQGWNREIAAAAAQAERGWKVDASARRDADGHAAVAVEARDHDGRPLTGVQFRAVLQRPANRAEDRPVTLREKPGAVGSYAGEIENLAAGQWELVIEADGRDGRLFRSESRVILR